MKNLSGILVNTFLILIGVALIVVPLKYAYSVFELIPFFSESQNGYMKSAVENIFYKGDRFTYGTDITPVIGDQAAEKADLPEQVTPELVSKFIMAQAFVNTSMADARFAMIWGPLIVGIFIAIGVVAILAGISLLLVWNRLGAISNGTGLNKNNAGNKNIDYWHNVNWKLIVGIIAVIILTASGFFVYIDKMVQTHYGIGDDGVCDLAADQICDKDCPVEGFDVDPDCANSK